jgi:hypothetical protein
MSGEPIQHWAQGLAKLGQGALGGYQMYQADQRDKETELGQDSALAAELRRYGGGSPSTGQPTPQQPTASPSAPMTSVNPQAGAIPAALAAQPPKDPTNPNGGMFGGLGFRPLDSEPPPEPPTQTAALSPMVPTPVKTEAIQPAPAANVPSPTDTQMADARSRMARMAEILANPNSSPGERALARGMGKATLAGVLAGEKPTNEIREFEYSQKNPAFKNYKTDLKRAGAIQNQVMIDQKGETEFAKESGKAQAKRFDELAGEGQKARQMVSDIDTLTELGKSIGTGKGAEITAKIGPWAESIGVPIKGLSDIQAFEAIANRVAPSLRVPGSGAQSDYELKNFVKSIPALGNTPEGNALVGATLKGLQENKIRASEIGSKALNGEITRPQAEKMLRELPDPMENFRAYEKANKKTADSPDKAALKKKYNLD